MSFLRKSILINAVEFIALGIIVLRSSAIARVLGPAGIGQYSILVSALAVAFMVCDFGVPRSFLYFSQHDPENLKKYLMHAFWIVMFMGIAGAATLPVLLYVKASYFGVLPLFTLAISGCYVLIGLSASLARHLLLVRIEARKLALMRIISTVCGTLPVLIMFYLGKMTVPQAIAFYIFAEFSGALLGWIWGKSQFDFSVKFDWKIMRKLSFMGIRLNWVSLMILLNMQFNILIIRYLLKSFESVGYFSRGQQISMMVVTAGQAVMPLLFSRWAGHGGVGLAFHVEKVLRFASTTGIIGIGSILLTGKWIVLILYGKEFLPAVQPLLILVPGTILYLMSRVLMELLTSRGHTELTATILAIGAAINVILCWLLIPIGGIAGAAWALTCGNILSLVLLMLIVRKKYNIRVTQCMIMNKEDIVSVIKILR